MRGSSTDQPRSSDDSMYAQPSDTPPTRSGRGGERVPPPSAGGAGSSGGGGDRPAGYQAEDRYWTDYLRIALPIAGLLLLLSVFWFWASSFIGDDNDATQTPVVAVNVTPQAEATLTPTLADAVQLTPQLPTATAEAAAPTQAPAESTQAPAEPTQAPAEPTQPSNTGAFVEGDLVVVNDNDVNMRAEPSTASDVVDTLSQGAELRVLSGTPTDFTDTDGTVYTYWNVSDDALGVTGWVVGQFLEK